MGRLGVRLWSHPIEWRVNFIKAWQDVILNNKKEPAKPGRPTTK